MNISTLLATAVLGGKKHDNNINVAAVGEPSYTCPNGFQLNGKICSRVNTQGMIPVCENGILNNELCEITVGPNETCTNGYSFDGQSCMRWEEFPPVIQCPPGFNLLNDKKDGTTCERAVQVPGLLVCPNGTVDHGKKCVSYSHVNPEYNCPNGSILEGQFCVNHETYDCSPTYAGGASHKKKSHHLRLLGEKKKKHGDKHGDEYIGSKGYQEERITDIAMMCERSNYSAPHMKCPENAVLDGKQCKLANFADKIQEKGMVTYELAEVEVFCPRGDYCSHGKKKHHGGKKHGEQCCVYDRKPTFLTCPSGHQLNADQDRCVTYRPPVFICKDGKKKNKKGQCSSMEYREPIITYQASYSCVGKDCGAHKHH